MEEQCKACHQLMIFFFYIRLSELLFAFKEMCFFQHICVVVFFIYIG